MTVSTDPLVDVLAVLAEMRAQDALAEEATEIHRMGHSPFGDESVTADAECIFDDH